MPTLVIWFFAAFVATFVAGMQNVLAGVMSASAVLIFLFSRDVAWPQIFIVAVAAIAGDDAQLPSNRLNPNQTTMPPPAPVPRWDCIAE